MAEQLVEPFPEGVVMVPLASVTDASSVVQTIAENLGLHELGSQPIEDMLRSYLQSRRLLLVLDNFEHLTDAAASIADLLESAPGLAVLVTSRSPLRVRAEQIVVVEGLSPAVARELFIERAGQAAVSIAEADVAAINEICRRLDCLPLAIELAAARTRALPPASLLDRLDAALFSADPGVRDLPDRQRTLHDTVAWSNDLLTPENQTLFSRLGVFSGGWSIDAAAAVSGIGEPAILDLHAALIDSSLVERDRSAPLFRMLETIRSFALEQQRTSGIELASRDRHATYYQQWGAAALDEI
ncbi:ATP-binding protein [Kribbella catacumbae]|uniref:ATP-binding protein n=1 Tax=Kribbella catacumbae TaxID=460086 RepID=UPI00039C80BD|nr:NB-ARC domain-containing protein [Kribbella catacumbae]